MIEWLTPDIAGAIHFLGVIPAVLVIYWFRNDRQKPGVRWFIVGMVAAAVWAVSSGFVAILDSKTGTIFFHNVRFFVASTAAISWFLLALEHTYKDTVSRRLFIILLIVPVSIQVLYLINPRAVLIRTVDSQGLLEYSYGPGLMFHHGFGYVLVVIGSSLWVGEVLMTSGTRRRQSLILLTATALLGLTSALLAIHWPASYIDMTVLGIALAGCLIGFAFERYSLFQIAPAARDTVINEMDDGVLVLNSEGIIADANPVAERLLNSSNTLIGRPATDVLADYGRLGTEYTDVYDVEETMSCRVDGVDRHFSLTISPVEYGHGLKGRAVVLRDITALKEREEELLLLKQILSRVVRHNIRNDLMSITGYAEIIGEQAEDDIAGYAQKIVHTATDLHDQTEKTREIEKVTDSTEMEVLQVADVVKDAADPYTSEYPTVSIHVPVVTAAVRAHPKLSVGIRELIQNAIEHHDYDDPIEIEIDVEDAGDTYVLFVEDNGPGIPQNEIDVLQAGEETDLQHGSGVGLWLVRWIVKRSNGELVLPEATHDGARIGIRLPKAETQSQATRTASNKTRSPSSQ